MPTLIVSPTELDLEAVDVSGDEYRHLFRALRLRSGDALRVVDGEGRARGGVIERVVRDSATVVLSERQPSFEPEHPIELAVAQLRPERASWLVEKATELGVFEILWFESQRSQHKWADRVFARLGRVARSAVEQSGRSRLPRVDRLCSWSELLQRMSEEAPGVGDGAETGRQSLLAHPYDQTSGSAARGLVRHPDGPLRIVVGPEGGFSEAEVGQAVSAGASRIGLGQRILRVETAAVALLSMVTLGGAIGERHD